MTANVRTLEAGTGSSRLHRLADPLCLADRFS
jgi:hypothetical protein